MSEYRRRVVFAAFMAAACLTILAGRGEHVIAGESTKAPQLSGAPMAPVGIWTNVTPPGVDLTSALPCGNFGTESAQVDPKHPSDIYTLFMCQGIWKSTDFGATWTGPINKGSNGRAAGDCAGGITISGSSTASVPTIYASCIRGDGLGFWKSIDGGVNWTRYFIAPGGPHQDYYPAVVDPYDPNHLLMVAHEQDNIVESVNGGRTWTNVKIASGMQEKNGSGALFFIDTGDAATTRTTWLWMAQASGGLFGTWRTANGGELWTQVDKNEHSHGLSQLYQPDSSGVVFIAGIYSEHGSGVLRSTDYGLTWSHLGIDSKETIIAGTSKKIYAMSGGPLGIGGVEDPMLEFAAQPGTGKWVVPGAPPGLTQGPGHIAVVNDGTHNILVGAMWNAGVWRYVEP